MQTISSRALAWVAPGGLTLLAAALWVHWAPDAPALARLADGYQYAVYALALLLAWRFQRSRVAVAVVALVLANAVLPATRGNAMVFRTAAFSLPITLALVTLLPDRGVLSPLGLAEQLIVLIQPAVVWTLERARPGALQDFLTRTIVPARFTAWTPLGQPALTAALAGMLVAGIVAAVRHRAVELGLFWSAVGAVVALQIPPTAPAFTLFLAASGLVLALSLIEHSYSLAYHDELTGLPARRALWQAVGAARSAYTLAVLDIDHFKKFNDRWGHDVGDQVLRMVATHLRRITGGRAFRYGGEEFVLLFPGMSRQETLPHLDSLRAAIAASAFTLRGRRRPSRKPEDKRPPRGKSRSLRVTVSIGAAERSRSGDSPHKVLKAADKALYKAKRAGRNRVK